MKTNENLPRDYNFGDPLDTVPLSEYAQGYAEGLKAGKPVCPVHHDSRCIVSLCVNAL